MKIVYIILFLITFCKQEVTEYKRLSPEEELELLKKNAKPCYWVVVGNIVEVCDDLRALNLDTGVRIVHSIKGISKLKSLRKISLNTNPISDIKELKELKNLIGIYVSGTNVKDISFLKDNVTLKELDISRTYIKNISFLKENRALEELDIAYCPYIKTTEHLPLSLKKLIIGKDFSKEEIEKYKSKNPNCLIETSIIGDKYNKPGYHKYE